MRCMRRPTHRPLRRHMSAHRRWSAPLCGLQQKGVGNAWLMAGAGKSELEVIRKDDRGWDQEKPQ